MGRKSALTPEQWLEIERRHVLDSEFINSLAAEQREMNPHRQIPK